MTLLSERTNNHDSPKASKQGKFWHLLFVFCSDSQVAFLLLLKWKIHRSDYFALIKCYVLSVLVKTARHTPNVTNLMTLHLSCFYMITDRKPLQIARTFGQRKWSEIRLKFIEIVITAFSFVTISQICSRVFPSCWCLLNIYYFSFKYCTLLLECY